MAHLVGLSQVSFEALFSSMADPVYTNDQVALALDVSQAKVTYLGTGSFGETWLVNGVPDVANKIIYRDGYPAVRLEREIEGLERVVHGNVVRLYGTKVLKLLGKDRATLCFEYVHGTDVRIAISQQPPTLDAVIHFAVGLFSGLDAMHSVQVIHRDLKPENLRLRFDEWADPVILDLGLAKILDASTVTVYPVALGTYAYMAPEQLSGERARKGADVWAAGVILYELIAGRHPFIDLDEAITLIELQSRMEEGAPVLETKLCPPLGQLIKGLLSVKVHERGSSAKALRELKGLMS